MVFALMKDLTCFEIHKDTRIDMTFSNTEFINSKVLQPLEVRGFVSSPKYSLWISLTRPQFTPRDYRKLGKVIRSVKVVNGIEEMRNAV